MIALLLWLWAPQVTPELRQHVEAGLQAKAKGDLPTAIREFRRVAELAPNLPAAHVNLGAACSDSKDYACTVASLRRALELNPDLPGAIQMLGAALLAQGYAAQAIPHLEKAQAHDLLGVALLETGRVREAVDQLETALQKRPHDPDLLYYLSQAHGRLAAQLIARLRAGVPDSARARQVAGETMAASGNRDAAGQHFRAALKLQPDMRGIHYALGELLLESGDYEKAETEFRAETQLAPGSSAAAYKLGLVLLNRGRLDDALRELRRADTLQPDMPETLLAFGKALSASGDLPSAERHLLRMLTIEQEGTLAESAHFQLAQVYRKLNRPADAERQTKLFQQLRGGRR